MEPGVEHLVQVDVGDDQILGERRAFGEHVAPFIQDQTGPIEEDLVLAENQRVVPVCLKPDAIYNVEEGLATAILSVLPGAKAVRYLRCLRKFHEAKRWRRVWQQTVGAGGLAWKGAKEYFRRRKR